jgi:hypothetical protein
MEEIISNLKGKRIDVNCGMSAVFRGENVSYNGGILELRDETGRTVYIEGSRIVAVSEVTDPSIRPGFIG